MNTVDPLALDQWDFYVLPTKILNVQVREQKTISLTSLGRLDPSRCKFGEIGFIIRAYERERLQEDP